jgi:acetylornithine deacetylase/succinyl-diaminopimelate desuccinylase-like protein
MTREYALRLASQAEPQTLAMLTDELRIPSVSTLPEYAPECRRCASFVMDRLAAAGLNARLVEGEGHPAVYGEWLGAAGKPTLLVYSHYDVQPPDPVEQWFSAPFEPTFRNGLVYARGAADSKGNNVALFAALEHSMSGNGGRLPVNVRVCIEGEEESGGNVLAEFLRHEAVHLASDCVLLLDGGFMVRDVPTMVTATRGLVYAEFDLRGPAVDLHSGQFGGVAPNPLNSAAWIIAALKDPEGRILIPGFYDDVLDPDPDELAAWNTAGIDEAELLAEVGSDELTGELKYPFLVRRWARPTLDVHGIRGGFIDHGTKTVIPSVATVKLSMRLVPAQNPERVYRQLDAHIKSLASRGTQVTVRRLSTSDPATFGVDHPAALAAATAFEDSWAKKPIFVRIGASLPLATEFARLLGSDTVCTGFNQPGCRVHAPNENMSIDAIARGTKMLVHFLWNLSERDVRPSFRQRG